MTYKTSDDVRNDCGFAVMFQREREAEVLEPLGTPSAYNLYFYLKKLSYNI